MYTAHRRRVGFSSRVSFAVLAAAISAVVLGCTPQAGHSGEHTYQTTSRGEPTNTQARDTTAPGPPTLVGVTIQPQLGQSFGAARLAAEARYGPLQVIRYFDPSLPNPWGKLARRVGKLPVVVSFKAPPSEVIAGRYDRLLTRWFAQAPRSRRTWWSYLPEPEDAVAQHLYTAEDFRSAWRHLDALAAEAHNPKLLSTLALMCYTLEPQSGRNWQDYYPGDDAVDVLAWDCYNRGHQRGRYAPPEEIFGRALDLSRTLGKPWAIAETGSLLLAGDSGVGRARWITSVIDYARANRAEFVTFFDADTGENYRLLDRPSQLALTEGIRSH
jgi:hypothetical protein